MIGRFAAATLAVALCATPGEAAPQALRGSIAAPADAADAAATETAVGPSRRAPRRSARRVQASERVVVVPSDVVLTASSGAQRSPAAVPIPPRRGAIRVAARPPVPDAVVAEQVVVAPVVSASATRGRTRERRVPARSRAPTAMPVQAIEVPAGEVVEVPEAAVPPTRGGRPAVAVVTGRRSDLEARIAAHSQATGVPADLIHHVITRESRYNPGAVGPGGVYGLMQIKHGTARALGYSGSPSGLLDPETNLTYGVRYLAGAYKVAGGNPTRAYSLFRSGYYYHAKRQGIRATVYAPEPAQTASVTSAPTLGDALSHIFAGPTQAQGQQQSVR